ncbi:MAG: GNAT family N-acetyltransferase [Desulfobacterales bacterium]|nr:MAG: GNAT family N-acetyltransferase [Desulfobacterales bacterium]
MKEIEFCGYYPGVVGKITEIHAVYYHANWGLDVTFETQVGRELSEFIAAFQEGRDGLWVALRDGKFAGSVAIDGRQAQNQGARLRWFIVVPEFQGAGIGKELIGRAMAFCQTRPYPRAYLWTFKGLEAARRLYEHHNFRLSLEHDVRQWGQNIKEQMYELQLSVHGQ